MDTLHTHFIRLAGAEQLSFKLHEPVAVTIDSLSAALCCTPRNVKFILRKLEEQGFIHWQPGRGRGHHSELTMLRSMNEALEASFTELLAKGKMKDAIELIGTVQMHDSLREQLMLSSINRWDFTATKKLPLVRIYCAS
ncbi:SgrR family transcriptional regulator [Paenibacillus sp. OVF10]|nr:SgrR family transcriptional regulator [Paenibacillus sp. OVF10]